MEKIMSILKFARTAAAASALAMLPVHAVAQTTATAPVRVEAPMVGANEQSEGIGRYIIPIVIVVALGIGLYFAIRDDGNSASA
jgi:hypothetical protein